MLNRIRTWVKSQPTINAIGIIGLLAFIVPFILAVIADNININEGILVFSAFFATLWIQISAGLIGAVLIYKKEVSLFYRNLEGPIVIILGYIILIVSFGGAILVAIKGISML